ALEPQLTPRAAVEGNESGNHRLYERFLVHVPDHQHPPRAVVLDDGCDQAVAFLKIKLHRRSNKKARRGCDGRPFHFRSECKSEHRPSQETMTRIRMVPGNVGECHKPAVYQIGDLPEVSPAPPRRSFRSPIRSLSTTLVNTLTPY